MQDFCEAHGRQRHRLGSKHDTGIAAHDSRCDVRYQSQQAPVVRRDDRHHAGWFQHGKIEVRRGDRIHRTEYLLVLVRPTGKIDQAVDRHVDFLPSRALRYALEFQLGNELLPPPLQHLGDAIQDLSPQVSVRTGPSRLSLARCDGRIPKILAAAATDVRDHLALSVFQREIAPRLGARKLAVDIDLVGLGDGDAFFDSFFLRRHDYASSLR